MEAGLIIVIAIPVKTGKARPLETAPYVLHKRDRMQILRVMFGIEYQRIGTRRLNESISERAAAVSRPIDIIRADVPPEWQLESALVLSMPLRVFEIES